MALSREDNVTLVGDLIAGTAVGHFASEFSKATRQKSKLVSNLNPTGTSYQNILKEGQGSSLQLKASIPADIWYFWPPPENFLEGIEDFTIELKDQTQVIGFLKQYQNNTDFNTIIPLMRYQTISVMKSFDWDIGIVPEECCGFLDFLVGPIGVMKTLSLCGEETGSIGDVLTGGNIIPPFSDTPPLPSINIVTNGYVTKENADMLADSLDGETKSKVHFCLRIKLMKNETFLTPGEFLSLLARPEIDFAWFFQDTSPFICGGNFFHTAAYTSGKITKLEGDNKYTVKVMGKDVAGISSSDYLEYFIGERVALIHTFPSDSKFSWKDTVSINSLRIIPITFYQTEGV